MCISKCTVMQDFQCIPGSVKVSSYPNQIKISLKLD